MQLPNPKELKALLKVCREFGVSEVTVDQLSVKFGDLATINDEKIVDEENPHGLTDEQLAFYSVDPLAEVNQ